MANSIGFGPGEIWYWLRPNKSWLLNWKFRLKVQSTSSLCASIESLNESIHDFASMICGSSDSIPTSLTKLSLHLPDVPQNKLEWEDQSPKTDQPSVVIPIFQGCGPKWTLPDQTVSPMLDGSFPLNSPAMIVWITEQMEAHPPS